MTTIVYRDGVLACDSRETETNGTDGDYGYVVTNRCKKIFRLPDGRLFGAAHSTEAGWRILHALQRGQRMPDVGNEEIQAILVSTSGSYKIFEGAVWTPTRARFYAIGSGARFALAAMRVGADAVKAAKVGRDMDVYSGGRIQVLRISRKPC